MRGVVLKRIIDDGQRTFGVLVCGGVQPLALTIENPWINNKRNISCIPVGRYKCKRFISPRFGETFEIIDVPGRGETEPIIFHSGNRDDDTRGCPIVGRYFGRIYDEPAILDGRKGHKDFMSEMKDIDEFELTIRNDY